MTATFCPYLFCEFFTRRTSSNPINSYSEYEFYYLITEAVKEITKFLGMAACERSDKVPEDRSSHQLLLAGVFSGGHKTLVRAKLALSDGVTMQLTVRSTESATSEVVVSAIG